MSALWLHLSAAVRVMKGGGNEGRPVCRPGDPAQHTKFSVKSTLTEYTPLMDPYGLHNGLLNSVSSINTGNVTVCGGDGSRKGGQL